MQELDEQEAEFCDAAARLGLDPFSVPESLEELILRSGEELAGSLLDDFLTAASPARLEEDLDWLVEVSDVVTKSNRDTLELPLIAVSRHGRHWERGFYGARRFRGQLGIEPTRQVDPDPWVAVEHVRGSERSLLGLGASQNHGVRVVALADFRTSESERFATARALWRFVSADAGSRFLITTAYTPTQQAERAFAAEFLAPAEGIKILLGDDSSEIVELDDVAVVSEHFGVANWVVAYQIINQLQRGVRDPALDRSPSAGY